MDSMSDAEFDAKVGFPVGERYVPKSKLDAAEARATAAERERDALREALRPFADMLDALENLGGMAKTGAWYIAESSVSGPREITFEHYHAARAALTANHSAPVVEE